MKFIEILKFYPKEGYNNTKAKHNNFKLTLAARSLPGQRRKDHMTLQQDFDRNWPKAKKQLEKFGKDALVVAEKGKKELVRFSKESKLRIDLTSFELKKEHLYYLIGKEFVQENCPGEPGEKLKKLIAEFNKASREQKMLTETLEKKKKSNG